MPGKPINHDPTAGFGRKKEVAFDDPEFTNQYPNLTGYLTQAVFENGTVRATSTILLFTDGTSATLCLNDRHNSRTVFVSAATFEGMLVALEEGLEEGTLDWKVKGSRPGSSGYTPF